MYSGNLLLRYLEVSGRKNALPFKVLMAFPKKKLGAVQRNRMRRICKSALFQSLKKIYESHLTKLDVSFNMVFHARDNFEKLPETKRIEEFDNLMERLVREKRQREI